MGHNKKRLNKNSIFQSMKGVVAIEFAIGALTFFMMIFYWMEVSYMGFVSATVDYAVAESSRIARTADYSFNNVDENDDDVPDNDDGKGYLRVFDNVIHNSTSLWANFLDESKFSIKVFYLDNVSEFETFDSNPDSYECENSGGSCVSKNKPIAVYRVSYIYQPIFVSLLSSNIANMTISREVIAVQEYERDKFNDNK